MQHFIDIALGYPTVLWTGLVGLAVMYWGLVVFGVADLEMFEIDIDIDVDVDIDADVDVDVDADADVSAPQAGPIWLSLLSSLGFGRVPVMIIATAYAFAGWMLSATAAQYLDSAFAGPRSATVILFASVVISLPLVGLMMHPLKGVFETQRRHAGAPLVGGVVGVTTGSVTASFGQGRLEDGGAGLLLKVRCEEPNGLRRGSRALIVDYDPQLDTYFIEPLERLLSSDDDEAVPAQAQAAEAA